MADRRIGPGALGLPNFVGVPEAAEKAWWQDLARWVDRMRIEYAHLWPERPPDDVHVNGRIYNSRPSFPACWPHHRGVVADLAVLKTWRDGLEEGLDWAGGVQGWHEWRVFLDRFASELRIVRRLCAPRHQEPALRADREGYQARRNGVPVKQSEVDGAATR